MKIVVAVSHDVIFKPRFLYSLALRLQDHEICHVMEVHEIQTSTKRKVSPVKFWGVRGSIYLASIVAFHKISSALPFPGFVRSLSTVKRVCALFDIPYNNVHDINSKQVIEKIKKINPDVVISFQHQIFTNELLNIRNVKFINCHPSLLPQYRGEKPIFWAMLNNDSEFGVTVHEMKSDIDCGGILAQSVIKVHPCWSLFQNYIAAYEIAVDTIMESIDNISYANEFIDTTESTIRYYHFPSLSDIDNFKKTKKII